MTKDRTSPPNSHMSRLFNDQPEAPSTIVEHPRHMPSSTEDAGHSRVSMPRVPDRLDWAHHESVVIHEQPATAIYCNPYGQVVIRQEGAWDLDSDDPFVVIDRAHLPAVIAALQAELEDGE